MKRASWFLLSDDETRERRENGDRFSELLLAVIVSAFAYACFVMLTTSGPQ